MSHSNVTLSTITQSSDSHREDEQWLDVLTGGQGLELQQLAYNDLSRYLYVIAYNYLRKRQSSLLRLRLYQNEELVTLSQDFVQSFMLKLIRDEYALLAKYRGIGRFPAWAAQVLLNVISSEFRKVEWSRNQRLNGRHNANDEALDPELEAQRLYLTERLLHYLGQLPEHYRIALLRCSLDGEKAVHVAADLGVSPNAVHILVHRAQVAMRNYLTHEEINSDTLGLFTN